jgi:hypothetical protein
MGADAFRYPCIGQRDEQPKPVPRRRQEPVLGNLAWMAY